MNGLNHKFVSVKIPIELLKHIDEQAIESMRSRSSQIIFMLNQSMITEMKSCATIQTSPSGNSV